MIYRWSRLRFPEAKWGISISRKRISQTSIVNYCGFSTSLLRPFARGCSWVDEHACVRLDAKENPWNARYITVISECGNCGRKSFRSSTLVCLSIVIESIVSVVSHALVSNCLPLIIKTLNALISICFLKYFKFPLY